MPKRLFKHKLKILFISVFVCAIVSVRAFEDVLFYDPFLRYFRNEFGSLPLPEFDVWRLFGGLASRYFLNMFFSLGIIYVLFRDFHLTKFSALLYLVFFIILVSAFFAVLHFFESEKMLLFYIRRFIIQPIFLLLFLPAFYYQKKVSKNNIS